MSFVLDGRLIEISLNHVCHIDMIIAYIIFKCHSLLGKDGFNLILIHIVNLLILFGDWVVFSHLSDCPFASLLVEVPAIISQICYHSFWLHIVSIQRHSTFSHSSFF
ncbi:Uncharacterised protein [Segatella copri]|nr:Uncharacterised protein [Segatella copri]